MRMESFIRRALGLKAHRVVKIEENESGQALVVHLDRREHRQLRCGECEPGRFSARRKTEAILRLLRGESLDGLARELNVSRACPVLSRR